MLRKNKKHEIKFALTGLAVGIVLSVLGYIFALDYSARQVALVRAEEARVLEGLRLHDKARESLRSGEASVSALKTQGIPTESADAALERLRSAFAAGEYSSVDGLYNEVANSAAHIAEEDTQREASYSAALKKFEEKVADYKKQGVNTATISAQVASASADLQGKRYGEIAGVIGRLSVQLDVMLFTKKEEEKRAAAARAAAAVVSPIAAQSSGGVTYERKVVNTSIGGFTPDILTVDMNRVKVKTFTANDGDCAADCPVKPLASYVAENGGIAGINGTYFCPPDYGQCSGVKNSFNTLVFDYRTKRYMNSSQNQYSVNPLISFYNGSAHFYTQALGYGRDTGANGVISNHPALMHNGGVTTNPSLDAKSSSKGLRCGIGFGDKSLWAVCTRGATVAESAYVFQSLGAVHAMNLDGGGSAALYFGGYKVGPGRLLPNAVVFTN